MPISYTEITANPGLTVTNRSRHTSVVVGGKQYMPSNGHASIGILDLAGTPTFSELTTGVTSRTRRFSFVDGTDILLPHAGSATVGVIDTTGPSYSEVMISRSATWEAAAVASGAIWMFSGFGGSPAGRVLIGRFDLSARTYTESLVTNPIAPTAAVNWSFRGGVEIGGIIHLWATPLAGGNYYFTFDPSTVAITYVGALLAGGTPDSFDTAINLDGIPHWSAGSSPSRVQDPTTSWSSGVNAAMRGAAVVGSTAWWPLSGSGGVVEFNRTAGVTLHNPSGYTIRDRYTCDLVATGSVGTMYLPSNGHESIGVLLDIPLPVVRRGYRGIGLVRGSRG